MTAKIKYLKDYAWLFPFSVIEGHSFLGSGCFLSRVIMSSFLIEGGDPFQTIPIFEILKNFKNILNEQLFLASVTISYQIPLAIEHDIYW